MKIGDRVRYTGEFWHQHTNQKGTIVGDARLDHFRVEMDSGQTIPVNKHNVVLISPLEQLAGAADEDR